MLINIFFVFAAIILTIVLLAMNKKINTLKGQKERLKDLFLEYMFRTNCATVIICKVLNINIKELFEEVDKHVAASFNKFKQYIKDDISIEKQMEGIFDKKS